jgi:polysaccharide biosynthesis protein PslF
VPVLSSFPFPPRASRSVGMLSTFPPRLCGLATFADALCRALEAPGCQVVRVAADDGRTAGIRADALLHPNEPGSARNAAQVLSTCDVAIVQHEFGIFGGVDGDQVLEVLDALTVPSIVVLHSVPARPTDHQRSVMERVCAAANRVVVMADAAGDRLLSTYRVDPSSVAMVPHGATLSDPADVVPSNRTGSGLHLLTWGLLGAGKGIEHVITALAMVDDLRPRVRYTIAGATHPNVFAREGNRYRHSLSRRSWSLGVAGSVVFDEQYRDVPALMRFVQSSSVVVLPYDSRDQATSGVLVDAIAAGRPVIATAFPHAVEVLSGGAGIIVPHGDPAAIAQAIRRLAGDPAQLADMAARARALAPTFSWGAVADRYLELCDALSLAGARGPS